MLPVVDDQIALPLPGFDPGKEVASIWAFAHLVLRYP